MMSRAIIASFAVQASAQAYYESSDGPLECVDVDELMLTNHGEIQAWPKEDQVKFYKVHKLKNAQIIMKMKNETQCDDADAAAAHPSNLYYKMYKLHLTVGINRCQIQNKKIKSLIQNLRIDILHDECEEKDDDQDEELPPYVIGDAPESCPEGYEPIGEARPSADRYNDKEADEIKKECEVAAAFLHRTYTYYYHSEESFNANREDDLGACQFVRGCGLLFDYAPNWSKNKDEIIFNWTTTEHCKDETGFVRGRYVCKLSDPIVDPPGPECIKSDGERQCCDPKIASEINKAESMKKVAELQSKRNEFAIEVQKWHMVLLAREIANEKEAADAESSVLVGHHHESGDDDDEDDENGDDDELDEKGDTAGDDEEVEKEKLDAVAAVPANEEIYCPDVCGHATPLDNCPRNECKMSDSEIRIKIKSLRGEKRTLTKQIKEIKIENKLLNKKNFALRLAKQKAI